MVINDFLRGKLPWYISDPSWPDKKSKEQDDEFDGSEGKLGEKRNLLAPESDQNDVSESESWDGLNKGSNDNEEEEDIDESDGSSASEVADGVSIDGSEESGDERVKDTRPTKKLRRD